jgi:hypothetical protein
LSCDIRQTNKIATHEKNERLALFESKVNNHQPDTLAGFQNVLNGWTIWSQRGDTTDYRVKMYLSNCSDIDGDIEFKNDSLFGPTGTLNRSPALNVFSTS